MFAWCSRARGRRRRRCARARAQFGDRVRFVPNVRGHVESFLSACDVLVFTPSPTEGEPRVIVMSQLVGLPVIATDPEGAEGLIPRGGGTIVSPSHDPPALAATIEAYREDPERRKREGEVARRVTLESHDPERTLGLVKRALGLEPPGEAAVWNGGGASGSPPGDEGKGTSLKIVSVMTTDSSGGAEFAAVEMLDALRQRGHETVMLTDMPGIGARHGGGGVRIDIGPKLSTRHLGRLALRWPLLSGGCARALEEQVPYDVLLVHYKKEQLLARHAPQAAAQHRRVGRVGPGAVAVASAAFPAGHTSPRASVRRW